MILNVGCPSVKPARQQNSTVKMVVRRTCSSKTIPRQSRIALCHRPGGIHPNSIPRLRRAGSVSARSTLIHRLCVTPTPAPPKIVKDAGLSRLPCLHCCASISDSPLCGHAALCRVRSLITRPPVKGGSKPPINFGAADRTRTCINLLTRELPIQLGNSGKKWYSCLESNQGDTVISDAL